MQLWVSLSFVVIAMEKELEDVQTESFAGWVFMDWYKAVRSFLLESKDKDDKFSPETYLAFKGENLANKPFNFQLAK